MKDDIIRMAQACWPSDRRMWAVDADLPRLERFFHMAQAAEREACAKEADRWSKRDDDVGAFIGRVIRARGEPEQEPVKRTVMYRPADLESLGLTHEDVVKLIKEQS